MQNDETKSNSDKKSIISIDEEQTYINDTIKESENEDSCQSEEKQLTPIIEKLPLTHEINQEECESEVDRRECDCCGIIPEEIINMNCVHNICVDCTLNVS